MSDRWILVAIRFTDMNWFPQEIETQKVYTERYAWTQVYQIEWI